MKDFEKLGVFYLGRPWDAAAKSARAEPFLYDSRDLTTHGVCVGMTGSGKTGLCIALLEEAAIDGIPSIAIDPKGDLTNLALTFPGLQPTDFAPWIDPEDARRQGLSVEQLSAKTAERWASGLSEWGEDGARIQKFRDACEVTVYTPGSRAGRPLALLRSFGPPAPAVLADAEALTARVQGAASGLLALVGIDADPLRSREHILLSQLFTRAWTAGQSLDLAGVIQGIQKPPFDRVGVLDLDSFFPAKERGVFALTLNNLLASPGASVWTEGEPLEIPKLLWTASGKPRIAVLSIAHLSDAQRMFFVTTLLSEVIAWMRTQPGTGSLRALLYMDEIFGFFPPSAMPPSKTPMLTLLKQARAFGLGVLLATQNPVDLDYKGLANTGTWFIGRLQTERDKLRVLDGLAGSASATNHAFDRAAVDRLLSSLGSRIFLMNDVHEDAPVLFQTRWTLSYLRGPLTLAEIQRLGGPVPDTQASPSPAPPRPEARRPVLPADVPEVFLPAAPGDGKLLYRPAVLASARLHYTDKASSLDVWESVSLLGPVEETRVRWDESSELATPTGAPEPAVPATFEEASAAVTNAASWAAWKKSFAAFLYQSRPLTLHRCEALSATSRPGEALEAFRSRLSLSGREQRDGQVDALRKKYAPKLAALQESLRRAQARVETEKTQVKSQWVDTGLSLGATVLGAMFGRKMASVGNLGRARTTARGATRAMKERQDVAVAEETAQAVQAKLTALEEEFQAETSRQQEAHAPETLELAEVSVPPRKSDVVVGELALAWVPWRIGPDGVPRPAAVETVTAPARPSTASR